MDQHCVTTVSLFPQALFVAIFASLPSLLKSTCSLRVVCLAWLCQLSHHTPSDSLRCRPVPALWFNPTVFLLDSELNLFKDSGCWSHSQCPQPCGVSPWAAQEVFLVHTHGRSSFCFSETLVFRHCAPELTTDHPHLFSGVSPPLHLSSVLADRSSWDLSSVSCVLISFLFSAR